MRKLDWDSKFFKINVWEHDLLFDGSINVNFSEVDLVYIKNAKAEFKLDGFNLAHKETKVLFSKEISPFKGIHPLIKNTDEFPFYKDDFYELAFESGKFSRFNLDPNFKREEFEILYKLWVDNSISKEIANKVFFIEDENKIIGFISMKEENESCLVGLIAIHPFYQGKGLGSLLMNAVNNYCIDNKLSKIKILTQLSNKAACSFYGNLGFQEIERVSVMHFWRNDEKDDSV